jgi:DNA polymerase-1
MGLITSLDCENKYVKIHLETVPDQAFEESIFKELKEKDKFGRKLYSTPVSIVGFKLGEDVLGFPYVPEVAKEIPQGFGMDETIEEVIAALPDKNTAWILDQEYHIVTDDNLEEIIKMFEDHEGLIAYDTETSGLNINFKSRTNEADQLVGVVLSRKPGEGYYFPLQHKLFANLCGGDHFYFMERYMRNLLENKKIICHNLKFDWKVAHIYDINVNCVYDTMLALGVTKRYEEESYALGLKDLTKNIFGRDSFELSDFVMGGSFGDSDIAFWDLPYELVRQYAPADTDNTYALYEFIEKEDIINKYNARKVFEMEITFAKAVAYSEFYGYHIDVENIPELQGKIVGEMERCKKEMFALAGEEFNPNSPAQLVTIMYDKLGVEKVGEKASTDKETLKTLASRTNPDGSPKYPFVKMLKTYRDNEGIYKNFLKKLPEFATTDGYIFPDVLQIGTNTGRVSVKNPNYQSYNDIVKHYVVPRPEFMHFDSDFAQIEQRVLVSYASIMFNDFESLALLRDFDDADMDYHQYQAARMFNVPYAAVTKSMRQQSKGINFGLPYGMGDESLGTRIFGERNRENTKKAADLRKKFFQGQELIEDFFEKVRSEGVRRGYTETQWGRRRYYHKGVFSVAEIRRQAGNHVIQGCIHGDTAIEIKNLGVVKIKDVAGLSLLVWNGSDWTKGDITYSGKKRKCVITFTNGQQFICSPIHKFLVGDNPHNQMAYVCCNDLTKGMLIAINKNSDLRIKDFKNGWFDFFEANMKDLIQRLDAGEKLSDEDKSELTNMVNKYKTNFFK